MLGVESETPPGWLIEDWNLVQVAKWLGVPPWDLAAHPVWLERAQALRSVEFEVADAKVK